METIGIRDPIRADSDDDVLTRFSETIGFKDNRCQVTWPWKADISLPDNYQVAEDRMKSLVQRLQTNPKLLQSYDDIIKQQLEQGVIKMVDDSEESFLQHHLPHHPIVTPSKSTTKLRIVY